MPTPDGAPAPAPVLVPIPCADPAHYRLAGDGRGGFVRLWDHKRCDCMPNSAVADRNRRQGGRRRAKRQRQYVPPPLDPGGPSFCLTQESLAGVYARRVSRGYSAWHPDDLIHRYQRPVYDLVGHAVSRERSGTVATGGVSSSTFEPDAALLERVAADERQALEWIARHRPLNVVTATATADTA
jgi:hypothetical protein